MNKIEQMLTMMERARALGLAPEMQATVDAAILAEVGIAKQPQETVEQDAVEQSGELRHQLLEHKRLEAQRRREIYRNWVSQHRELRVVADLVAQAIKVAGSHQAFGDAIGAPASICRTFLDGFTAPQEREARIIADLIGYSQDDVVDACRKSTERINTLRASSGMQRSIRRMGHN